MTSQGQRFRRRALRRGYKVDEVDGFLDRVEATLSGAESDAPVSAQEVHDVVFRVRFGGYDEWQVDLHLDRVERQLAEREESGGRVVSRDTDLGRPAGRGEPRRDPERAAAAARPGEGNREAYAGRYDGPPGAGREPGAFAGRGGEDRGYGDRDEPGYPPNQTFPGRGLGRHGKAEMTNEMHRLPEREDPRYGEPPPGAPYGGPARPEPAGPPVGYRDREQTGPPPGYGDRAPAGPPPGYGDRGREPAGPPPGYVERDRDRGPAGPPAGYGDRGPAGPPPGYGDRDAPPSRYGERQPAGPGPYGGGDPSGYPERPPAGPPPGYAERDPAGPGLGRPPRAEPGYGQDPQEPGGYGRGRPEPGYPPPGGGYGGRPEPGYGGPGPGGPGPGGGFGGAPSAGPPGGGLPPAAQRVDALRRGFQPRRFGSGYDPAEVDRLFEGIISALAGRGPMPASPGELERARFGLVPGGYFEAEVESALREVGDILRRF
ncbi:hypothetical protein GCM10010124_20680 [Pilimelia terevasa]|uniref:DivIVA domain-containing protein n=1 Tax=Pilimelia terevasa TaxID=53372 RepID=A0A8J3BK15_9ACTN|nr:DivIVA domain-containing protein [Pilimelia terevasa]GGK27957.1 hypothetical protein GCM10010124_20680 [Pilimelia terevasa]